MSKQYPGGIVSKTPVVPTSLSAPGIWSLSDQAAAQATNTWPFPRDPQFKNVTMLLHGDGSAGPVAATGVGAGVSTTVTNFNADASTNNFNVTINGDAKSNNFTPYQTNGYWSVGFTGAQTSPSLTYPSISAYDLGATSQFTYECWVYFASVSGEQSIFERFTGTSGPGWLLTKLSTNVYRAHFGASVYIDTSAIAVAGQWIHLAVSRDGSTGSLFVDGIRQATTSSVVNFSDGTDPLVFGERNSGGQTFPFNGYISNARIVKGTYVYNPSSTSITVPTSPLTAITNTVFLGLQSYRYLDNSSNAATATIGSASSVQRISPFTQPAASLNTIATYGAGYFDGTGDWLQTPSNSAFNFSATDCTLEFWYYGAGASGLVFEFGSSTPDTAAMQCEFSSGTLTFKPIGASSSFFAIQTNAWNYIAAVKTGTTYYLYINGTRNTASTGTAASSGQIINIGARNGGSTAPITGYLSNFRVSNTARYTGATMTVPTTILSTDANTQLLITQYNGGGNNSGFKDSSQFNFPITRNGNTTQGTFTPYSADWSNYFNGSSYFTIASNSVLNMNTYACLECWVNLSSSASNQLIIGRDSSYWLAYDFSSIGGSSTKLVFSIYNGSAWQAVSSSTTPAVGTWYHLVGIKDNTTLRIYINGTQENTATFSGTPATGATPFGIASNQNNTNMTGYISNARFNLGSTSTALPYTANFTSSAVPLTAVTGTQLLTCQSNRFIDNSTNALTLSVSGTPSVQGFSPFAPLTVYNPTTYGGSLYGDGTGDYLSIAYSASNSLNAGDFTVEAWVYKNSNAAYMAVGGTMTSGAPYNTKWQIIGDSGGTKITWCSDAFLITSSATLYTGSWYHVAFVRSSGTLRLYINGVLDSSSADTRNYNSATDLWVAQVPENVSGRNWNGYITNFRINPTTAVYTTAFTPPTAPLTATTGTSFLLATTNAGILDNAMMNNLETVGNAAVSTSVKKYGAASIAFDGTGDYLLLQGGQNFTFGTGDFTIEMWIYVVSGLNADIVYYDGRPTSTNGLYNIIYTNSTGKLVYSTNSADRITGTTTLSTGTWYHIALSRSGTSSKLFLNGTQEGSTYTDSNSYIVGANRPVIGSNGFTLGNAPLNGYIDDLRITKAARYTTTFTVPDQAFPNG